jgi:hypothetical protein
MDDSFADTSKHHQLVEEIATRVEEKIIARFAWWLLLNAAALIVSIATGIAAFYSLKSEAEAGRNRDDAQDYRMGMMQSDAAAARQALEVKLDRLAAGQDEINRFLRDHNAATMSGFNRNGK